MRRFQRSCVTETDLSDFYKMTITVLKIQFRKLEPKVVSCRNCKDFSKWYFLISLNSEFSKHSFSPEENGFDQFCQICTNTLNKYAPHKKNNNKGKSQSFYKRGISKAIMKWTQPRYISLNLRTSESKLVYTKLQIYCVNLIVKHEKKNYGSLDVKDVTDSKKFWKTVKPLFSYKSKSRRTRTLVEDIIWI